MDVEVWVHVGVIGGETLALCVDVIVFELVNVGELVPLAVRDGVNVCVPDWVPVVDEVDVMVAEGLGSTEGVMESV